MEAMIEAEKDVTCNKEQFWKKHAKSQRESGLSRVAYCRKHQLNYEQFGYWEQKWRQASGARLLPVHVASASWAKIKADQHIKTACTLTLKNGHVLQVHDQSVLPLLLSLLG